MGNETKVDFLVERCIQLKGDSPKNKELYGYGPSVCARCKEAVKAEGQEALSAVATVRGIYFTCKMGCKCGSKTGFVSIVRDE